MFRKSLFMVLFFLCNGSIKEIRAETPSVTDQKQTPTFSLKGGKIYYWLDDNGETQLLDIPYEATSIMTDENKLYVSVGEDGVIIFELVDDTTPVFKEQLSTFGKNATGFFKANDEIWIELKSINAIPLKTTKKLPAIFESFAGYDYQSSRDLTEKETKPIQNENNLNSQKEKQIIVIDLFSGEALINAGLADNVKIGQRFRVFRYMQIKRKQVSETFHVRKEIASVEVTAVNPNSSLVKLGRGVRLKKGDFLIKTDKLYFHGNTFPQRLYKLGEVEFVLRPIFNISGSGGMGVLTDAEATWYNKHSFFGLRLIPFGFGNTRAGNIWATAITGEGGYDSRAIAIGLGIGMVIINGDVSVMDKGHYISWEETSEENTQDTAGKTKAALAFSNFVRLGEKDGLNMKLHNLFFYHNDPYATSFEQDSTGFIYGGTTCTINFPLSDNLDLRVKGGGGKIGYALGEIGLFAWIKGNGDAGSFGIYGGGGISALWRHQRRVNQYSHETETISAAGPSVSLGFTHRFSI